jgi:hypothetical protein
MAYVRSLREISPDEEPHASVVAALLPVSESPYSGSVEVDWASASEYQLNHLAQCPACAAFLGGVGRVAAAPTVGDGGVARQA